MHCTASGRIRPGQPMWGLDSRTSGRQACAGGPRCSPFGSASPQRRQSALSGRRWEESSNRKRPRFGARAGGVETRLLGQAGTGGGAPGPRVPSGPRLGGASRDGSRPAPSPAARVDRRDPNIADFARTAPCSEAAPVLSGRQGCGAPTRAGRDRGPDGHLRHDTLSPLEKSVERFTHEQPNSDSPDIRDGGGAGAGLRHAPCGL